MTVAPAVPSKIAGLLLSISSAAVLVSAFTNVGLLSTPLTPSTTSEALSHGKPCRIFQYDESRRILLTLGLFSRTQAHSFDKDGRPSLVTSTSSSFAAVGQRRNNNIGGNMGSSTSRCVSQLSSSSMPDAAPRGDNKAGKNNRGGRGGGRHRRPGRRKKRQLVKNPAMADTNFLRKRTEELLRITSPDATATATPSTPLSSKGMKVDRRTFNFLIDAWAFSGEPDAAEIARNLLRRMESLSASSSSSSSPDATGTNSTSEMPSSTSDRHNIQPDVRSYTKVINAYARSGRADAGERAEAIMREMERLYTSGENTSARPNAYTYTGVIEAYANSHAPGSGFAANRICEQMITKAAEVDVYSDEDLLSKDEERLNARAFNAAIRAWADSGELDAAIKAESILGRMKRLYRETEDPNAKPNAMHYNSVISAWANSGEKGAAQRAETILKQMEADGEDDESILPTTSSFNAVIDAWAKSGEEGAAEKAEDILDRMEQMYQSGSNVKPNVRSFNSVINAWAKSRDVRAAQKAEEILDRMRSLAEEGDEDVRPDATSFSTVINAWARSHNLDKAERALDIHQQMCELYESGGRINPKVRPNVVIYNAVMNACAFTMGDSIEQHRAMEIAHSMLTELEKSEHGTPDQITYGTFLKVCANQMPEGETRDQIVNVVFRKCAKDGQVGRMVLQQMKSLANPESYEKLLNRKMEEDIDVDDLPLEW
eukprot:CAMPEP_0185728158 /NCGR_PEP_ID=MMETSP1171-20130828/3609_1 /TAXON_ID=374046 /ORGANISM="Helicotheca tamensis, Strain CCMP826" /LENGTH=714 /DNA_ID=CAMNT_0028396833 /DNA_START=90 /DNA_END=2231 /DNA_ORIENTATION=-